MGVVAGNALIVNTDLAGDQSVPSIAALANGGCVVSQIYNANESKSGVLIEGLSGDGIILAGVKIRDLDKGDFLI